MNTADYAAGGVISQRPFRMRRLGHIAYDVDCISDTLNPLVRNLGLHVSNVLELRKLPPFAEAASDPPDPRVVFLTTGSAHHGVVLLPLPIAFELSELETYLNFNPQSMPADSPQCP